MLLFALDPECTIAPALGAALDESLSPHEDRAFEDGEHKLRPLVDPRGADAYVICSLHGGPERQSARQAVSPAGVRGHLARARGGARHGGGALPGLRAQGPPDQALRSGHAALRGTAVRGRRPGADHRARGAQRGGVPERVSLHDAAPGGASRVRRRRAGSRRRRPAGRRIARPRRRQARRSCGASRSSNAWAVPVGFAMVDKRRSAGLVSSANLVAGDVGGMTVLLLDDLIASGETMKRAAQALRARRRARGRRLRGARPLHRRGAEVLADASRDAGAGDRQRAAVSAARRGAGAPASCASSRPCRCSRRRSGSAATRGYGEWRLSGRAAAAPVASSATSARSM